MKARLFQRAAPIPASRLAARRRKVAALLSAVAGSAYPVLSAATVTDILATSARPRVTITVP